jgi:hypothetical protein
MITYLGDLPIDASGPACAAAARITFDFAVRTQVYEYVGDVPAALAEAWFVTGRRGVAVR